MWIGNVFNNEDKKIFGFLPLSLKMQVEHLRFNDDMPSLFCDLVHPFKRIFTPHHPFQAFYIVPKIRQLPPSNLILSAKKSSTNILGTVRGWKQVWH